MSEQARVLRSDDEVDRLVSENVRLAKFFANKQSDMDADQAFSLALEGLLVAAQTWDERIPFGSYASLRIKWRVTKWRNEQNRAKRGGQATFVSFDQPVGEDAEATVGDFLADDRDAGAFAALLLGDNAGELNRWLARLKPVERLVLERRFGLDGDRPKKLHEVGTELGVTRERVRQIEAKALKRLRVIHSGAESQARGLRWKTSGRPYSHTREGRRRWRLANPDKVRAMKVRHYQRHRDKVQARNKARYQRHRASILQRLKLWRAANAVRLQKRRRRWYEHNQARAVAYSQRYYYENRDTIAIKGAHYRQKHRDRLRQDSRRNARELTDRYVRELLSKNSDVSAWEWTEEQVAAKRQSLLAARARRLTDEQVLEIRNTFIKGSSNLDEFAQRYGCNRSTIWNIVNGKTRAHVLAHPEELAA